MKFTLYLSLLFIIIGCQKIAKDDTNSKIAGKWEFAHETYITSYDKDGYEFPPPPPRENLGFNFFSKDSCESNFSFFKVDFSTQSNSGNEFIFERDVREKLGRKTNYKIKKNSLKIFDRTFNRWHSYKIIKLDENNLIINDNDVIIKNFVRTLKK